jgi:DNA-binding NarL/FixJ family response regulator
MSVHSPELDVAYHSERLTITAALTDGDEYGGPSASAVDDPCVRVLIVHEHDVIRSGFRLMLGRLPWVERCLEARNAEEAQALWLRYDPHIALVDLVVNGTWGTDLCWQLRRQRPEGRVLLMSANQRMSAAASLAVGAAGFVAIGAPAAAITEAVRLAWHGRPVSGTAQARSDGLSERQRQVLGLLAGGATNREIAEKLCLSPHTVKGHISELYRRLRVRNRAQAVQRAGLVGFLA